MTRDVVEYSNSKIRLQPYNTHWNVGLKVRAKISVDCVKHVL